VDREELREHLSQISTAWTALAAAHDAARVDSAGVLQQLLLRYGAPAYRYLLACLRDPNAADDAYQQFALRFLRGDFRRARPDRGRFRDFLKSALYHLVVDQRRARARTPLPLDEQAAEAAVPERESEDDRAFVALWRAELLERAWEALARSEQETGKPVHTVLHLRKEHPEAHSAELATRLTTSMGKPISPEWVRKWLLRGREKFSDLLLREVAESLEKPTADSLGEELADLGLLEYCKEALKRWG
jgi:RNA polymerase sigma-70 factor (ECF subfamily)